MEKYVLVKKSDVYRFILGKFHRISQDPFRHPGLSSAGAEEGRLLRSKLAETEHQRRMEYARIEHERRMELIEAEAALLEAKCRRLAEQITPSNARLDAMVGTFSAPPGTFDDEEMPY